VLPLLAEEITKEINVLPQELVNLGTRSNVGISGKRAVVIMFKTNFKEDRRDNLSLTLVGYLTMYFGSENGYTLFYFILF
jgi:hypothetical protein